MAASQTSHARLLYASTESSADLHYLVKVKVPDAFPVFIQSRRSIGFLSILEINRVSQESALDEVHSLEALLQQAREYYQPDSVSIQHAIAYFAHSQNISTLEVPGDFPSRLTRQLEQLGLHIQVAEGEFFPERIRKTAEEAAAIRLGNIAAAAGFRAAKKALREATILPNRKLQLHGKLLTSERLRTLIEIACLEHGAVASHTICAGGDQACDPHQAGHGPLRANELIIIDIFPRHSATGYHGDMTRTFLKGRASEAQTELVSIVHQAQKNALAALKANVSCRKIHQIASRTFEEAGYLTGQNQGVWQGYIHSTGHGLGLEVHEQPRVSQRSDQRLLRDTVVTIEPGLYYPGLGACRIEDVAQVTRDGYTLLSNFSYQWRIP